MRNHSVTRFKWLLWAAVLLWAGWIFYMSAQRADASNSMSGGLIQTIASLFPSFREKTEPEQWHLIEAMHVPVRKAAHWFLYFVLGGLSALLSLCYTLPRKMQFFLPLGGCLLYALSDELHQYFVPGRSCSFPDVLIDFCGAAFGLLMIVLLFALRWYQSAKKPYSSTSA